MSLKTFIDSLGRYTKSLTTIDIWEREILRGNCFQSGTVISSLAPEAITRNRIHSSTTKYTYFKSLLISSEGATIEVRLLRNAVVDTVGTQIPNVYKQVNDNSSKVATTTGFTGSTYTSADLLRPVIIHGDTTALSTAGTAFTELAFDNLVCSKDSDYFLEIENKSTTDTAMYINIIGTIFELDYGLED